MLRQDAFMGPAIFLMRFDEPRLLDYCPLTYPAAGLI
jgi:hypothetical protein